VKREEVCAESCRGGMGEMCGFYVIERGKVLKGWEENLGDVEHGFTDC
jgi:hypothetical protein